MRVDPAREIKPHVKERRLPTILRQKGSRATVDHVMTALVTVRTGLVGHVSCKSCIAITPTCHALVGHSRKSQESDISGCNTKKGTCQRQTYNVRRDMVGGNAVGASQFKSNNECKWRSDRDTMDNVTRPSKRSISRVFKVHAMVMVREQIPQQRRQTDCQGEHHASDSTNNRPLEDHSNGQHLLT